ncbi:MAG TPA: NADH-quinone oxidoreductase subunit H, partial [Cytophagales bacterium]|nr:NADH-quinone oxidoreductase subunit H [Cytophagales bacterium]
MDWTLIIYKTILLIIIMLITLLVAMYSTYGERKVAAYMQDRR